MTMHPFFSSYIKPLKATNSVKGQKGPFSLRHHLGVRVTFSCRSVPQLIESVNDRLADLYALAQGEVLDDVRLPIS
jgi:hypothetical protein